MSEAERLVAAEMNTLRGRVLGQIEAIGLPNLFGEAGQRQEDGIKALFKTLTYDAQARLLEILRDTES